MKRDISLDTLRGLLLVVMTVDHIPGFISRFLSEAIGFVTAAEGFIFLSGYVAGMVYSKHYAKSCFGGCLKRALRRFGVLYVTNLILFVILFTLIQSVKAEESFPRWGPLFNAGIAKAAFFVGTFLYLPPNLDIIPMYCILVIIIPFLIDQFEKGKSIQLLAISVWFWLIAQRWAPHDLLRELFPSSLVLKGGFNVLAWQILFVLAFYFGFKDRTWVVFDKRVLYSCLFMAVLLCILRHSDFAKVLNREPLLTGKSNLGILRLLNFLFVAILTSQLLSFVRSRGLSNRFLAILGRNSLSVFAFQVVITAMAGLYLRHFTHGRHWEYLLIVAGSVLSLLIPCAFARLLKLHLEEPRRIET